MLADDVAGDAVFRRQTDVEVELAIAFQHGGRRGAGHRRLDDGVDVAGIEAVARRLGAVDRDVEIRLPQHAEDAEIGHAADLLHLVQDLIGELFQDLEVGADDLDRVGAFDAGDRFLDVVLDILREIEVDAGERRLELGVELGGQVVLGQTPRPFGIGLQRREQLDVGEGRGVAAVVGPAVLRHDRDDLGMAEQDLAHFARRLGAAVERHGRAASRRESSNCPLRAPAGTRCRAA